MRRQGQYTIRSAVPILIGGILLFSMSMGGPALFGSGANAQSVTHGELLASTNQGELVSIDLLAGAAMLLGQATVPPGRFASWGWSDLAFFEPTGDLFAVSRRSGELGGVSHLYRIDPDSGEILEEIGSTGISFLTDIDFAADDTLYGNRWTGGGGLIVINPSNAVVQVPGNLRFGQGLQNGGLAVHPLTGELWGIESSFSGGASIFTINPNTGLASNVIRVGLNGLPISFGFDALEILSDGMFIATRARGANQIYEVNPVPDPDSGLAEVTLIPMLLPAINGTLNGLTEVGTRFADFTITKVELEFDAPSGSKDRFEVDGEVMLGELTDGIDPVNEDVLVRVGTASVTIPPLSFMDFGSTFRFKEVITDADGNVKVKMKIKRTDPEVFEFKVKVQRIDLTGTPNPLNVTLRIGNDFGTTRVRLEGKLEFEEEDGDDDDDD